MTIALIALGLGGYAWFLLWRVRVEQGWVGITDFRRAVIRLTLGVLQMSEALGAALLPAFRRATEAMLAWSDAWIRSQEVE